MRHASQRPLYSGPTPYVDGRRAHPPDGMEPYSDMRTARGVFALFTLLAAARTVAPARAAATACPAPASETCVRAELGVPVDAKRVVIVSQSSHLDWDWRHTFEEYFLGPLNDP